MFAPHYDGLVLARYRRLEGKPRPSGALGGYLAGDAFVWLPVGRPSEPCLPARAMLATADGISTACPECVNVFSCLSDTRATSPLLQQMLAAQRRHLFVPASATGRARVAIIRRIRDTLMVPLAALANVAPGAPLSVSRDTRFDVARDAVLGRLERILAKPEAFDLPPPFPCATKLELRCVLALPPIERDRKLAELIEHRLRDAIERIEALSLTEYQARLAEGLL